MQQHGDCQKQTKVFCSNSQSDVRQLQRLLDRMRTGPMSFHIPPRQSNLHVKRRELGADRLFIQSRPIRDNCSHSQDQNT